MVRNTSGQKHMVRNTSIQELHAWSDIHRSTGCMVRCILIQGLHGHDPGVAWPGVHRSKMFRSTYGQESSGIHGQEYIDPGVACMVRNTLAHGLRGQGYIDARGCKVTIQGPHGQEYIDPGAAWSRSRGCMARNTMIQGG